MAAFIDEDMNILHTNKCVLYACLHRESWVACWHSQLLLQELKNLGHVLVVPVSHVLKLCFWRTQHRFPCAIGVRILSHHGVFLELLLPPAVSSSHWKILLSTRLRVPDFWSWSEFANCFQLLFPLLFFHRNSTDRPDTPNCVKRCPRSSGHAPPSMVSLSSQGSLRSKSPLDFDLTWRSAVNPDRQKENHRNGYKRTSRNSMLNKRRWFHPSREKLPLVKMSASWFLVSTNIFWFGSWVPILSCRRTNQAPTCVFFLTLVSSLDFCPWSFWSLLRCL